MFKILLAICTVGICQGIRMLDDLLSQLGVVSVIHGSLLGYGQIYVAKKLLEWGNAQINWFVVVLIGIAELIFSIYKISKTGTRWVFAFNFGIICGIIYAGFDFI